MSDIVLASLAADEPAARRVVEALHAHDLDFWWEQGGDAARASSARCVVLVWTRGAAADAGFRALATRAVEGGRAILALMDATPRPPELAGVTAVDLSRFRGRKGDLFLMDLLAAARAKAAGIDPPPARGPLGRLWRRLVLLIPTALLALGILANVLGVISVKDLLKFPRGAERQAWAGLKAGSCDDLRSFRAKFPDGYYFDRATALLTNPARREVLRWAAKTSPLEVYAEANGAAPRPDRAAAEADAVRRAQAAAEARCGTLAGINGDRLLGVDIAPEPADCAAVAGGFTCGLAAKVTCRLDARVTDVVEVCAAPSR